MSFILKENPIVVNIKLTDEGRKKLASGNFNISNFSVGDSEIDYEFYNSNNFNINNSIVLSSNENIKDIRYKIKKYNNTEINNHPINALTSKTEVNNDLNLGFFTGDDIYKLDIIKDYEYVKEFNLIIDNSTLFTSQFKNILTIRQGDNFVLNLEPEVGDYIMVKWINPNINYDSEVNSEIYQPYLWYKILEITGSLANNNLSVIVDRDLPDFGELTANISFSYCMIFPKFNSMESYYGNQFLSTDWNFTDDELLENKKCDVKITPVLSFNIIYPKNNLGFKVNDIYPNDLNSYRYFGFLNYISEYNKDSDLILGIIHYTNTSINNNIGEGFYNNTPELLLPTIMWYKNKDNKLGVKFTCSDELKKISTYNIKYYDLIDNTGFVVGKCFIDIKIFLIEDQELLTAMNFKSNRNWTLPPSTLSINQIICPEPDQVV